MWNDFIRRYESNLRAFIRREICKCNSSVSSFTTAERDALTDVTEGKMIYNSETKKYNFYNGTDWEVVTSV